MCTEQKEWPEMRECACWITSIRGRAGRRLLLLGIFPQRGHCLHHSHIFTFNPTPTWNNEGTAQLEGVSEGVG